MHNQGGESSEKGGAFAKPCVLAGVPVSNKELHLLIRFFEVFSGMKQPRVRGIFPSSDLIQTRFLFQATFREGKGGTPLGRRCFRS